MPLKKKKYYNIYDNYYIIDPEDPSRVTENTRKLGLVVARGTHVSLIGPSDEMQEIANPFEQADEEEDINVKDG